MKKVISVLGAAAVVALGEYCTIKTKRDCTTLPEERRLTEDSIPSMRASLP